ncbi:hypothetical protein DE146DRAFT_743656 [Phaeosphaeria sp. MPI-PUGE-AT-0046c]|nr:hypothetical protein DE146DRAFT_743656 [Phaeosphaeria sp. MPI-PUGE-AT-0046c]
MPGNQPARNAPAEPKHGQIRSVSRTFDTNVTPSRRPYLQGPASPPQGHRPIPTVVRPADQSPTDLQRFSEFSITPFCRWAFVVDNGRGGVRANHNYDPDIDNAIWWSETIDAFDNDSRLIHELILRIADQDLGHPAMEPIRQNRAMVEMLLYRHYQRHGGVLLPPMGPANEAMLSHQRAVEQARAQYGQRINSDHPEYPRIRFPSCSSTPKSKGKGPTHGRMGEGDFSWNHDRRGPPGGGGWGAGPGGGGINV